MNMQISAEKLVSKLITPLFIAGALLFPREADAQATIIGKVMFENQAGIHNAKVTYTQEKDTLNTFSMLTDVAGYYQFANLPTGIEELFVPDNKIDPSGYVHVAPNPGSQANFYARTGNKVREGYVYNILGQLVATIDMEVDFASGVSYGHWNGKTSAGAEAATGAYFFAAKGENGLYSGKIIHNKNGREAPLQRPPSYSVIQTLNDIEKEKVREFEQQQDLKKAALVLNGEDGTPYIVTIEPTDESAMFSPRTFTRVLQDGDNGVVKDTVYTVPEHKDISGVLKDLDTHNPLANVNVALRTKAGIITYTGMTDAQGRFNFEDVPSGEYDWELSKANYWSWNIPVEIAIPGTPADTAETGWNEIMIYSNSRPLPEGGNHVITLDQFKQMVGERSMLIEYIMGRQLLHNVDGLDTTEYRARLNEMNDLVFPNGGGLDVAIRTNQPFDIGSWLIQYNPYNNFFPGQIGTNIEAGGNTTSYEPGPGGLYAVAGEMELSSVGDLTGLVFTHEHCRLLGFKTVATRPSIMQPTQQNIVEPTDTDMAIIHTALDYYKAAYGNSPENAGSKFKDATYLGE
jgi:hypothetical protein